MGAGRRLFAWAPAWLWLFWLAGTLVAAAGLTRGGPAQPRFLVATGEALEIWHGAARESTLVWPIDGGAIFDLALSSDASQIAFITLVARQRDGDPDYGADLYIVQRDGTGLRLLLEHALLGEYLESPVWLPGGREVALAVFTPRPDQTSDVHVEAVDVASGKRRRLVEAAYQPALMPGGQSLIVLVGDPGASGAGEKPALYDLTTGKLSDLPLYKRELTYIGSFAPSPNALEIAFAGADPNLRAPLSSPLRGTSMPNLVHPIFQDVWLMDTNGANLLRLADLGLNQPSLTWSADGLLIYVISPEGFFRVDARTGAHRQIGPGVPNGRLRLLPER